MFVKFFFIHEDFVWPESCYHLIKCLHNKSFFLIDMFNLMRAICLDYIQEINIPWSLATESSQYISFFFFFFPCTYCRKLFPVYSVGIIVFLDIYGNRHFFLGECWLFKLSPCLPVTLTSLLIQWFILYFCYNISFFFWSSLLALKEEY